jgi:hypothetical protein
MEGQALPLSMHFSNLIGVLIVFNLLRKIHVSSWRNNKVSSNLYRSKLFQEEEKNTGGKGCGCFQWWASYPWQLASVADDVTISESLSAISPVNKHPTQMPEQELDNNKMDIPKHQALIQGVQKQQAEEEQEGKKPDEKRKEKNSWCLCLSISTAMENDQKPKE